jgi:hypothetical protein
MTPQGGIVNLNRLSRQIGSALLFLNVTSVPHAVYAQVLSLKPVQLPSTVRVSDVEIRLLTGGGDGCNGPRCVNYRITIRGDGSVELEDVGTPPTPPTRRRSVAGDLVLTLVNEFLKVRFFDALDHYDWTPFAVRKGDSLVLYGRGGSGGWTDITMRLGSASKTVRLEESIPADLLRLKDLVWRIGGPKAWTARKQ